MNNVGQRIRPTGGAFSDRGWWRKLDLIHDGRTFLRRRGLDLRIGGILIHRIDAPDPGMDLHDHPWAFMSIVLRGGYAEEWADTRDASLLAEVAEQRERAHQSAFGWGAGSCRRGAFRSWSRWSIHRMPLHVAHRIAAVEPGTITLIVRTRKVRRWGFYMPAGWIDWEAYDYATRRPLSVESSRPEERMTTTSPSPATPAA